MALSIVSNTASLNGQRNIARTQASLNQSLSRLSSGLRINSAMDDAAGLGVSERMRAQVRGLAQASRNASDGLSVVQTAEGAMGEISGILIRMRELTVQSASDTITDTEREYIDLEFKDMIAEVDRINQSTKFNGNKLLQDFSANGLDFQVGFESGTNFKITVAIDKVDSTTLGFNSSAVNTKAAANTAMSVLDTAIDKLNKARAGLGSKGNRLVAAGAAVDVMREGLAGANSRIRDTDIAAETSQMSRSQVLMQAGTSMLAQANSQPQLALSLLG